MKKITFLSALMIGLGSLLVLQSVSGGRAAVGGQDRTGSPIANGTCAACHFGGNFSATSSAVVTDSTGNSVTSYIPDNVYTVTYRVTGNGANAYAMQAAFLDSNQANGGDFLTTTSTNTQLSTIRGIEYMEHQGAQSSGIFTATWKAPAAGTGTVTLYGIGLAVDGNRGTGGDDVTASLQLTLTEDNLTSVYEIEDKVALFEIYPTPNQGIFTLKNNGVANTFQVQVVNMAGQIQATEQLSLGQGASQILSFPNLTAGAYTIILKGDNYYESQQLIIVK